MLRLLGPAVSVDAHLDTIELPEGTTDASFVVGIRHASGVRSYLSASKLNYLATGPLGHAPHRGGARLVPSEQGRYHAFYEAFERAVRSGTAVPVTAEEAKLSIGVEGWLRREVGASGDESRVASEA